MYHHDGSVAPRTGSVFALAAMVTALAGCSSVGGSGPTTGRVLKASEAQIESAGMKVIDVDAAITRQNILSNQPMLFSAVLGDEPASRTVIGVGDVIDISIVEAPPAVLFSGAVANGAVASAATGTSVRPTTVSQGLQLPQQLVDETGRVSVPFAGSVLAAGRTPQQIARDIAARLRGKAHDPQVIVRRATNATSNFTILGDVAQSGRFPLTARGERLLDAIAVAGGPKQPVGKTVVRVSRDGRSYTLPLEAVLSDPRQNVVLRSEDLVTILFKPYSFTALGAIGTNAEIDFEGSGFTLAQALGRIGGLQDNRADVKGVFIFRFENPAALPRQYLVNARLTPEGRIPVIYRLNLSDPASLFVAQNFPVNDKDILYVSNAPLSDFSKFVNMVAGLTFTIVNVGNAAIR